MARVSKTALCQICKKEKRMDELYPGAVLRPSVFEEIRREYPHFDSNEYICLPDLQRFRYEQIRKLLEEEKGELTKLDEEVLQSLHEHEMLHSQEHAEVQTLSERLADRIAAFGGSWKFIILFFVVLISWMTINGIMFVEKAFDPFPFILLNLTLSCVTALQGPIIMMSQNRQAEKDRKREEIDYKTNLKAELEIRMLHEKMDRLMKTQWQRLIEIQQIQMDFMQQISHSKK